MARKKHKKDFDEKNEFPDDEKLIDYEAINLDPAFIQMQSARNTGRLWVFR